MLVKSMLVNALLATPPGRAWYRNRLARRGYDPDKDSPEYIQRVFGRHWVACHQPMSGAVLEIGPGGNVAVAKRFADAGCAPVVCIDHIPYVDRSATRPVDYRAPEDIETTDLPAGSFDVIYSHAVLEHVHDPARAVAQIARLLRSGGITSHVVDLRDHRDFERPHAFLAYPDWIWRLAGSRRGWPNRWRAGDWARAFRDAGLTTEVSSTESIPVPPQRIAGRFADKEPDDLAVVGISIVARKP